jgi:hypothetical protein
MNFKKLEKYIIKKYGKLSMKTVDDYFKSLSTKQLNCIVEANNKEIERIYGWYVPNKKEIKQTIYENDLTITPIGFIIEKDGKYKLKENFPDRNI